MMLRFNCVLSLLLFMMAPGLIRAQDVTYIQSGSFNVPALEGWEDQSADESAQFYLAEAQALIRISMAPGSDAAAAAKAEIETLLERDIEPPVYSGTVNLADGTWHVLVYEVDAATTASVMARRAGDRIALISFVEDDPAARTLMIAMPQADDALDDATPEIGDALSRFTDSALADLGDESRADLPSGSWTAYRGEGIAAMGMVFGNDSFIALQEGQLGDLAALADAWNRTLLGFFITPDNSVYLALGLAVAFAILGTLVLSFVWRARGLEKDRALLEELARTDG